MSAAMNSPKAGARGALRKRLRDTLGLLVLMLVTAFILLLYQARATPFWHTLPERFDVVDAHYNEYIHL